jgi:hypothetical protein
MIIPKTLTNEELLEAIQYYVFLKYKSVLTNSDKLTPRIDKFKNKMLYTVEIDIGNREIDVDLIKAFELYR